MLLLSFFFNIRAKEENAKGVCNGLSHVVIVPFCLLKKNKCFSFSQKAKRRKFPEFRMVPQMLPS